MASVHVWNFLSFSFSDQPWSTSLRSAAAISPDDEAAVDYSLRNTGMLSGLVKAHLVPFGRQVAYVFALCGDYLYLFPFSAPSRDDAGRRRVRAQTALLGGGGGASGRATNPRVRP